VSKVVVTSDWHLDAVTYGVSRHQDVKDAALQVVAAAFKESADLVLFLGDLCDPDDGPWALQCVETAIEIAVALKTRGIASWWIAGNHDVIEDGTGRTTLSPLRALGTPLVRVFEEPAVADVPGFSKFDPACHVPLLALPFTAACRRYDPDKTVWEKRGELGDRAVVAGHMTCLAGARLGEETHEMARGRSVSFPVEQCRAGWLKLNGHFHDRQVTNGVHVPGALARLSFGEAQNRPSYLIFEI